MNENIRNNNAVITVKVTRNNVLGFLTLLFMCWAPGKLGCETFTLKTYYPSPVGVYNKFTSTGETALARNTGNVGIGTGASAPTAKLDVVGNIRIRNGSQAAGKVLVSDANGNAVWGDPTYAP